MNILANKMNILVVENDEKFRNKWVKALREHYAVTPLSSLVDQTPHDLHNNSHDLALIDRRVENDDDPTDRSGENFAIALCGLGTPTVLVTGHLPTDITLFDLLRTGAISAIASKNIDVYELLDCIEEFRHSRRFPNCIAQFYLDGNNEILTEVGWNAIAAELKDVKATGLEISVLFRSVVPPCAREVWLRTLTPGHGGAALFHATVSSGDGPVREEVAIKYGDRSTIMSEAMRYDRHVGPLPDGVAAHLRWRKETRTLGAIAYTWVSDSLEDGIAFGPVCGDPDLLTWRRRQNALARLFSVALNPWYRVFRSDEAQVKDIDGKPATLNLLKYYTDAGGFSFSFPEEEQQEKLPARVTKNAGFWDFGKYGKLPDPVAWLTEGAGSALEFRRYAPCHGDLHVKNIFVLPDDSPRLIDFGDTALGHVFRDFAALEASVRLTCCNARNLNHLKLASDCASSTKTLGEYLNHRPVPKQMFDLRKSVASTMQIRRAALDAVSDKLCSSAMKEYLFALIFRMLRYASGIADEVSRRETPEDSNTRLWHALYAAAKAAEQASTLE